MGGWKVPRMWDGGRCFILGGSPCLLDEPLELIEHERCIGVNNAYELGDWVDICWFGDERWFEWNRRKLLEFGNIKACCVDKFVTQERPGVKALSRGKPQGIDKRIDHISWNNNSGFSAINLAVHLGVKTIVLLGFAMKEDDGSWDDSRGEMTREEYDAFLKCARERGPLHGERKKTEESACSAEIK